MAEWHTIRGRFTSEQLERINQYQKKYGLNDNQFLRKSVEALLGVDFINKSFMPCLNLLLHDVKKYREELKSNAEDLEKFDQFMEEILRRFADSETLAFQNNIRPIIPAFNTFKKFRKRGAPKKVRKRGKPSRKDMSN